MQALWKSIFFNYLFSIFLFFFARIVFYVLYLPKEGNYSLSQILFRFFYGLRFDTAAFFIGFGPFFFLFFAFPFLSKSLFIFRIVFSLILSLYLAITLGGMVYYGISGKHPTHEFLLFFQEFFDNFEMVLQGYSIHFAAIIGIFPLAFLLSKKLLLEKPLKKPSWPNYLGQMLLFLVITLIAIRGGLQKRPLRPAFAFLEGDDLFLANLSLNSVYTSFYSVFHKKELPIFYEPRPEEKQEFIKQYFGNEEVVENLKYPFYRKAQKRNFHPYNIVLFIMESWSAQEIGIYGGKKEATPFFDFLSEKGLLFLNCYATNRRSIQSLPSIISSIPSFFGITYITSNYQTNRQTGLGSLLKKKGYATYFAYAAKKGSMGFDSYARQAGFSKVFSEEDFPKNFPRDGTWGVFDEFTFLYLNEIFASSSEPFLGVIYSLHPHPPFRLPPDREKFYEKFSEPYQKALRYSDDSLRKFFEKAQKEKYFKNTLFVITADHAYGQQGILESHHIPLLFYLPQSKFFRGKIKTLCSQLDILPTLLHIIGYEEPYSAFGQNLFSQNPRYVLFDSDSFMVFLKNGYLALFDRNTPKALYSLSKDFFSEKDLLSEKKDLASALSQEYLLFVSLMNSAIVQNEITP